MGSAPFVSATHGRANDAATRPVDSRRSLQKEKVGVAVSLRFAAESFRPEPGLPTRCERRSQSGAAREEPPQRTHG